MCNYLPQGVNDNDPTAPWNRPEKPEPESFGSDCCKAEVRKGTCTKCNQPCMELLETDEDMYRRLGL